MIRVDKTTLDKLLSLAGIKSRLKKELRFGASTKRINAEGWENQELIAVTDRSGNEGVLMLQPDNELYILPYHISKGVSDKKTGRYKPIICGFCNTWQPGDNAAIITFSKTRQISVGYMCCADLACSDHVRSSTKEALRSRTQLREDLGDEERIERLKSNLRGLINNLNLSPLGIL